MRKIAVKLFSFKSLFTSKILKKKLNLIVLKKIFLKDLQEKRLSHYIFVRKNNFSKKNIFIGISQKKNNPKGTITISTKNIVFTFSIGSIIKYFKVDFVKHLRRGVAGTKIFFNVLKSIFEKKYSKSKCLNLIFSIAGFDFNLLRLRKQVKTFFQIKTISNMFFIFNLKISFSKKKNKKIKSIKKRLKKKMLVNFAKTAKTYNTV